METLRKMKVSDVMLRNFETVREDTPIGRVLKIFERYENRIIAVTDSKGDRLGEIIEGDALKMIIDPRNVPAHEMDREPFLALSFFPKTAKDMARKHPSLGEDDTIEEAARKMYRYGRTEMPVIKDGKKITGILTEEEMIKRIRKPTGG
jgi:predicted transcriptional regulator